MSSHVGLQGGADSIAGFLEGAPPEYYLVYLFGAGLGLPCSEDAFVVWVGSRMWRGIYGGWQSAAYVLAIVYAGVVISDLVSSQWIMCRSCMPDSCKQFPKP